MNKTSDMQYIIALYIRLSAADRDIDGRVKDESNSVTAQRDMLYSFVKSRPDLRNAEIIEFCDDGKTGTNFERSGVSKMLDAARGGLIHCIIVKDLSRFGRDYIEVGDYLEQIFPFLGIRFIAVNDGYDSSGYKYGSAGLVDVSFKNIVYDMYSKELSEKVRTTKRQLDEKGYNLSPYAFFGYDKAPGDKHKLVIDEEAAAVVRELFRRAESGERVLELARSLNERGEPMPMMRKRLKNVTRRWNSKDDGSNIWNDSTVRKILEDERYTGCMISGKTRRIKVGSPQTVRVHEEEWIVVPDAFPAIVGKDAFDRVQAILRTGVSPSPSAKPKRLFSRKICCGYCRLAMTRKDTSKPYYVCLTYRQNPEACCPEDRVYESEITAAVLASIRTQAQLFKKNERCAQRQKEANENRQRELREKIKALQAVIDMKSQEKMQAFEDMSSGRITLDAYQVKCERCDAYIQRNEEEIKRLEKGLEQTSAVCGPTGQPISAYTNLRTLTWEIVEELIDKIYVYSSQTVEIVWKFKDEYGER